VNSKQNKTLELIFKDPIPSNIKLKDVESLFIYLGATVEEGNGSRVRIQLNGIKATFHRPHPSPDTGKATIKDIRKLLKEAGVSYVEV
jgi:hypothetical protein